MIRNKFHARRVLFARDEPKNKLFTRASTYWDNIEIWKWRSTIVFRFVFGYDLSLLFSVFARRWLHVKVTLHLRALISARSWVSSSVIRAVRLLATHEDFSFVLWSMCPIMSKFLLSSGRCAQFSLPCQSRQLVNSENWIILDATKSVNRDLRRDGCFLGLSHLLSNPFMHRFPLR
jgi:hypothetical protein